MTLRTERERAGGRLYLVNGLIIIQNGWIFWEQQHNQIHSVANIGTKVILKYQFHIQTLDVINTISVKILKRQLLIVLNKITSRYNKLLIYIKIS